LTTSIRRPFIGRRSTKSGQAANEGAEDLASPHILRSLSNVAIVSIHGGPTASHFVCLDRAGGAWLFGRNEALNLGSSTGGSGGAKEGYVPETCPRYLTPTRLGHPDAKSRFTSAIIGRSFTLLVTNDGTLYAAGDNKHGQLGLSPKAKLGLAGFTRVESCKHLDVVGGAAGGNFTLLVCKDGKVYALGSAEHGQTGTGRTGEHIAKANTVAFDLLSEPTLVGGALAGRKVVQVACGTAHSIALDDEGLVYTWVGPPAKP
jgi:alpha-tubulin suppressor-like RCC1 family protein